MTKQTPSRWAISDPEIGLSCAAHLVLVVVFFLAWHWCVADLLVQWRNDRAQKCWDTEARSCYIDGKALAFPILGVSAALSLLTTYLVARGWAFYDKRRSRHAT